MPVDRPPLGERSLAIMKKPTPGREAQGVGGVDRFGGGR